MIGLFPGRGIMFRSLFIQRQKDNKEKPVYFFLTWALGGTERAFAFSSGILFVVKV